MRPARRAARIGAASVLAALIGGAVHADDAPGGGAQTFTHICQGCHMPGAEGAIGAGHYPKLAGDPALVSWQYVALTVLNGRRNMPAFGLPGADYSGFLGLLTVRLTDAQVADVVNYLRGNFGNHYREIVTAQQVAALPHPGAAAPPR